MRATVEVASPIPNSFRAAKVQGMFDIPSRVEERLRWNVTLPIEDEDWQVGAIVGPSGSGKTTIARKLWPDAYCRGFEWSAPCLLDDFSADLSPQQIVEALTAVGLSSPPVWLRPYRVLSTGQQFRASLARALLANDLCVYDEFTSVVDRTVAKAAASAAAMWVRRSGRRFVAVTCHDDVLPWLEVDWYYDMASGEYHRGRLHRPSFGLGVYEGTRAAWPRFVGHHYLTGNLHQSARVFLAYVDLNGAERLVGFFSIMPQIGMAGWWRGHRTVVLPDYQGLGIGNRMIEGTGEWLWEHEHKRLGAVTSAPSLIQHRLRHPELWRCRSGPKMTPPSLGTGKFGVIATSAGRLSTSWEYIPEALRGQVQPSAPRTTSGRRARGKGRFAHA